MGERKRNSIGTSLRGCIRDIADGNHPIERVERIVSPIAFSSKEEMIAHLASGRSPQRDRMADIAGRLWDNGKISPICAEDPGLISDRCVKLWLEVPPAKRPSTPAKAATNDLF